MFDHTSTPVSESFDAPRDADARGRLRGTATKPNVFPFLNRLTRDPAVSRFPFAFAHVRRWHTFVNLDGSLSAIADAFGKKGLALIPEIWPSTSPRAWQLLGAYALFEALLQVYLCLLYTSPSPRD